MKDRVTAISLTHPRATFIVIALLTLGLGSQIPSVVVDTNPENMLSAEQPDRVFYDEVLDRFSLHDTLVVGMVNTEHESGVFTKDSLARLHQLSGQIAQIEGVIRHDLMSLATVDNVSNDGVGTVRFEWMMNEPPQDDTAALAIRDAVRRLPTLDGTLMSENGKAVLVMVPIEDKSESYRIVAEIDEMIAGLGGADTFFITGLPAAEDTFGVQMFIQMAISAPLAALVIFFVMFWFFRSWLVIAAPMILAMATVITTMGLLIGMGFDVHIMSSMIPIFLMPIAVVDSVHVLSEFSDRYRPGDDPGRVITDVMKHLFTPMLFTSLTSAAGFFSLMLTPIPPVQVFGAFVGFGILLAFIFTVTFVPAYVISLSTKHLDAMKRGSHAKVEETGLLARSLRGAGRRVQRYGKLVTVVAVLALAVSGYGISQIQINDNPVRWFHANHEIRVADDHLNRHFAGTYPAFLVLNAAEVPDLPATVRSRVQTALEEAGIAESTVGEAFNEIESQLEERDGARYLAQLVDHQVEASDSAPFEEMASWDVVLAAVEAEQVDYKVIQSPETLAYIAELQAHLESMDVVGNTTSLTDIVQTVYRELLGADPSELSLPGSSRGVAQTLLSFQSSHRPDDLWHFVTSDFRSANVWVQLKSGDNQDMADVESGLAAYVAENPPPDGISLEWSGATHLNMVWQQEMVRGMGLSLLGAFGVVFLMMTLLFRSPLYGLLSMVPLTFTMVILYGIIGIVGKDYDMPVAVLSSLTLGLSVDFAIHFLQRVRSVYAELGSWSATLNEMFEEPARAISRNAIVIAIGFLPLLAAPLVPYNTVGILMAAIMAVSGLVTLVLLPTVLTYLRRFLFGASGAESHATAATETQQLTPKKA